LGLLSSITEPGVAAACQMRTSTDPHGRFPHALGMQRRDIMKRVNICLSNTNYTAQDATDLVLDKDTYALLQQLILKIEARLYEEHAAYMQIEGLLGNSVKLTITEYD
jgi:hypothetical protein